MFGPARDIELLRDFNLLERLDDQRTLADMTAWFYFQEKVIHSNVKPGWSFDGCSFSQRGLNVMLVMKATHEDTPYVAFITEQTTTGCVRTFCRLWLEERVEWYPDKYRKT